MNLSKIKKWLWLQKEGFAVGAVVGGILYYMGWSLPIKIPYEGATKLIILVLLLGGIGALIDSVYKPNK